MKTFKRVFNRNGSESNLIRCRRLLLFLCFVLPVLIPKAQVPVSKEPRHHEVFENNKVRLLNVLLSPHDTTQYHIHSTPSVFICFTKTNTTSQLLGKAPGVGVSSAGSIWFENLNAPHTKIHRVWNNDTSMYHVMDIEILSGDSNAASNPLVLPHLQTVVDTPWVRAYKIELSKSEQVVVKEHLSSFILVAINEGMITMIKKGKEQDLAVKPATFFWIHPSEQFTLVNKSASIMQFALVEIK